MILSQQDFVLWLQSGAIIQMDDDSFLIGYGPRSWKKSMNANDTSAFYFPDFFLEMEHPWFVHKNCKKVSAKELVSLLRQTKPCKPNLPYNWQADSKENFTKAFNHLQNELIRGDLLKAVPYSIQVCLEGMNTTQLHKSLLSSLEYIQDHKAFIYGFWDDKSGILGVTPEILFKKISNTSIESMACAGTKPQDIPDSEYIKNKKEGIEHRYVVESIVNSLSVFGQIEIQERKLVKQSELSHFITPIILHLNQKSEAPSFETIVCKMHPTPALGAYPKKQGEKWLNDYDKSLKRNRFGAPVGCVIKDGMDERAFCYVAIRNVQWDLVSMNLFAGCGVIKDSVLDKEWDEINLKWRSIKEMLAL